MTGILALALILVAAGLLLALTLFSRKATPSFREIPAYTRLRRAMGIAVEDGSRVHISLGRGRLQTPEGAAALAGLSMLRRLVEQASVSDKPPIVTSGDGALTILSQDTMRAAYKTVGAEEFYSPITGRLAGLTPFSYAAGAIPAVRDEQVSANVILGNFGPEVALLTDSSERNNSTSIAAADNPSAQALLYASVEDPLVGEELFAAGAYSGAGPSHLASLQVQDFLRWLVILILLGGSTLKLLGLF